MAPRARNKFGALMFEPELFQKQIYSIEESTCDIAGTFRCPRVIWRPGHCTPPFPPSLCPWFFIIKKVLKAPLLAFYSNNLQVHWIFSTRGKLDPHSFGFFIKTMLIRDKNTSVTNKESNCETIFGNQLFIFLWNLTGEKDLWHHHLRSSCSSWLSRVGDCEPGWKRKPQLRGWCCASSRCEVEQAWSAYNFWGRLVHLHKMQSFESFTTSAQLLSGESSCYKTDVRCDVALINFSISHFFNLCQNTCYVDNRESWIIYGKFHFILHKILVEGMKIESPLHIFVKYGLIISLVIILVEVDSWAKQCTNHPHDCIEFIVCLSQFAGDWILGFCTATVWCCAVIIGGDFIPVSMFCAFRWMKSRRFSIKKHRLPSSSWQNIYTIHRYADAF